MLRPGEQPTAAQRCPCLTNVETCKQQTEPGPTLIRQPVEEVCQHKGDTGWVVMGNSACSWRKSRPSTRIRFTHRGYDVLISSFMPDQGRVLQLQSRSIF